MIVFYLIFGVAMLVTAYYIFALLFHWFKYGSNLPLVWVALPIYLVGAGFLTIISLAALAGIS